LITSPSIDVQANDTFTPSIDDYRTSAFSRGVYTPDELVEAEPFYTGDDEYGMIRSDRSVERAKAVYYRPGRYERSPQTSFISND
jgi:hypothetical protein